MQTIYQQDIGKNGQNGTEPNFQYRNSSKNRFDGCG